MKDLTLIQLGAQLSLSYKDQILSLSTPNKVRLRPWWLRHRNKQLISKKSFMPCPFTGPKMFCAGPNVLSHSKNLIAFSASSKTFVPAQKPILLNANHLLVWHKMFVTGTICK